MGNTDTKRTVDDTILDEDAMREYFRNPDYSIQGICGKKIVKFVQKPEKTNTTIYVFNIAAFFDHELGLLSHLSAWFSLYHMTDTKYRNLYDQFVKEGVEPVSAVKRVMRKIEEEVGRQEEYELCRKIDKNVCSARVENAKKKILENYNKIMQEIRIKMLDEDIEKVIEKFKENNVIVMKIDESDSENNEGGSVVLKYFEDLDNAPLLSEQDTKLIQAITLCKTFYRGFQFSNNSAGPCIDDIEDQRMFIETKKHLIHRIEEI